MLTVSNLTISRGAQDLLREVTFSVPAGRRAALIGANGSGKSTLLETIQGRHPQRAGSISWTPADLTVGYLDQSGNSSATGSVGEFLGATASLEQQVATAAARLAAAPDDTETAAAYSAALERLTAAAVRWKPEVLRRWGVAELDPETPVSRLSGSGSSWGCAGSSPKAPTS